MSCSGRSCTTEPSLTVSQPLALAQQLEPQLTLQTGGTFVYALLAYTGALPEVLSPLVPNRCHKLPGAPAWPKVLPQPIYYIVSGNARFSRVT